MSPFVTTLDAHLFPKLKADLQQQNFELTQPQYTVFQARKKGLTCTLYTSGKLVVQGKEMKEWIEFYLEPELLQDFSFSYGELELDQTARIGIDESGKGDVFGPLVVGGVFGSGEVIQELHKLGVKDSKAMTDKAILKLAGEIRKRCPYQVLLIGPAKYNELYSKFGNLNRLLAWGHATTIENLAQKTGCKKAIIDQFAAEHVVEQALERKKINIDLTQRTKGEEDIIVAAASILARAAFLNYLEKMHQNWGQVFPKGASAAVVKAGQAFVGKNGREALPQVAKMHFKTVDQFGGGQV